MEKWMGFAEQTVERHNFSPYFEGMENPFEHYDDEENQKQYELEQRQRTLERRIRDTKRQCINKKEVIDNCKDEKMKFEYDLEYQRKANLLKKQNEAYNQFCKENGLRPLNERIQVAKWNRQQAAAARGAAKRYEASYPDLTRTKKEENKSFLSIGERKHKMETAQATNVDEAIEMANKKGVKYARFNTMNLDRANNILNAIDTLPEDSRPILVSNGKEISIATGRPLGRKADQWYGVTYDYRNYSIRTMQLGYDSTDYDGGQLVGINASKYKTIESLTKAKKENNKKYRDKTGRDWSFNIDGRATAYHEIGHCYVNVHGLPDGWENISAKWANESECDILKNPNEAFAEAWAAYHMADDRLPQYIEKIIEDILKNNE